MQCRCSFGVSIIIWKEYRTNFDSTYKPIVGGFFGIFFWIEIAQIISFLPVIDQVAVIITENTFSIMMHHLFGFFTLNCIVCLLSKFDKRIAFDEKTFRESVFYTYYPPNHREFLLLYILFGVAVSLFIVWMKRSLGTLGMTLCHRILS